MSSAMGCEICKVEDRRQPGGKWVDSGDESSKQVKYSPKRKHGKPVGRREVVEKYLSMGPIALERAFNGGDKCPDHADMMAVNGCKRVNGKHFAIHARASGYAHKKRFPSFFNEPKSTLRRRAAKAAAQYELLDFDGREEAGESFTECEGLCRCFCHH